MIVIGDVHGRFRAYERLCQTFGDRPTLQLGDMGIGFPSGGSPKCRRNDWWFRGNHDNPEKSKELPNYLGEGGTAHLDGVDFFYVPGAWSIDQKYRVEGSTWWREEELSVASLQSLQEAYTYVRPKVVITHDAPKPAAEAVLNRFRISTENPLPIYATRTGEALSAMFEYHQPDVWVFGHYHTDWHKKINGTKFICLNELSWTEV